MKPQFRMLLVRVFLAAGISLTLSSVSADTLLIDAISEAPPNDPTGLPRPVNGQTMDMVHARFGAPIEELEPVGNPPINRWIYDGFTVYFERNRVISSAVHQHPTN